MQNHQARGEVLYAWGESEICEERSIIGGKTTWQKKRVF